MTEKQDRKKRLLRRSAVLSFLLLLFLGGTRFMTMRSYADSIEDQERILSRPGNAVTVFSSSVFQADMVTHDIICEVRDEKDGYGFAHFRRNADGHFILAGQRIRSREKPIVTGDVIIKDEAKVIIMYDRSGIDHAIVTFTDDTTGTVLQDVRVPFEGGRYEIIDAPPVEGDPSVSVQFFDEEGEPI